MGTKEKLVERFKALPRDFTYDEVVRLFAIFGYVEDNKGGTSGSRVKFVNPSSGGTYIMHKPHPSNVVKAYALRQMLAYVEENKLIEKYVQSKK